jgi:hypothetical protein
VKAQALAAARAQDTGLLKVQRQEVALAQARANNNNRASASHAAGSETQRVRRGVCAHSCYPFTHLALASGVLLP